MRKHRLWIVFAALALIALGGIAYVKHTMNERAMQRLAMATRQSTLNASPMASVAAPESTATQEPSAPTIAPPETTHVVFSVVQAPVVGQGQRFSFLLYGLGQIIYESVRDHDELTPEAARQLRKEIAAAAEKDVTPEVQSLDPDRHGAEEIIAALIGLVDQMLLLDPTTRGVSQSRQRLCERAMRRAVLYTHLQRWEKAQQALTEMTDALVNEVAPDSDLPLGFSFPIAEAQYLIPRLPISNEIRERWDALLTSQAREEGLRAYRERWERLAKAYAPPSPNDAVAARRYLPEFETEETLLHKLCANPRPRPEVEALLQRYIDASSSANQDAGKGLLGHIPKIKRLSFVNADAKTAWRALKRSGGALSSYLDARAACDANEMLRYVLRVAYALEDYRAGHGEYPENIDAIRDAAPDAIAALAKSEGTMERPGVAGLLMRYVHFTQPPRYVRTKTGYAWLARGSEGYWTGKPEPSDSSPEPEIAFWSVFRRPASETAAPSAPEVTSAPTSPAPQSSN